MATIIDTEDQAYQFFVQESSELLQHLETGLMNLTQTHDQSTIHGLMRAAHSIKGGAACIGLSGIQTIAHDLENGIRALYNDEVVFDRELEDLFLQAFDCLREPINEQIQTGRCHEQEALERSEPIFRKLEGKFGHALEEAAELPEVQMEGDITEFIFAEEVPQGLNRWDKILDNPAHPDLVRELTSQAEVFITLGEMLNLVGFASIARTTVAALTAHPQEAIAIARIASADLKAGHQAVLEGDRQQGGSPSAALQGYLPRAAAPDVAPIAPAVTLAPPVLEPEPEGPGVGLSLEELAAIEALTSLEDDLAMDLTAPAAAIPAPPAPVPPPVAAGPIPPPREAAAPASPPPTAVKEVKEIKTVAPPIAEGSGSGDLTVRIDTSRLNYINNLVGELVTQDNSFLLRNKQHQASLESLKRWYNRIEKIVGQFQQYSRELVIRNPAARAQLAQFVVISQTLSEEMAQLAENIQDATLINLQDQQLIKQRQQTIKQVENNLLEARMLPIGELLNRFPRTVRDLSVQGHKPVKLVLEGTSTLVDRGVLSKLYDPLVHLVRNAFDHGIDDPATRQALGKPEEGIITIRAYNRGNSTYVEIEDDGQGINLDKIRAKAIQKGLISQEEAQSMSEAQLYEMIFVPGFSTADRVSHISGRGVGLDAVRLQIRALKGNITLASNPGTGTVFTLRLPWSMTINRLLVFRLQEHFFAVPVNNLASIAAAASQELIHEGEKEYYHWQGKKVPLVQSLLLSYGYPSTLISSRQQMMGNWDRSNSMQGATGRTMVLLINQGNDTIGIRVDQILLEQDLVIKPFGKVLNAPSYCSGCTVLGDGQLIAVLDGPALLDRVVRKTMPIIPNIERLEPKLELPLILVVDDSLTTRQTLSTTLQKGGYRVIQAQDGADGLNQLEQHPQVRGVICDVEMPNMNGFEFLGRCRKKHPVGELPVLMVTSRSSKRYRELAKQLGANGYLTKPYLDKELIETLAGFLAEAKA